MCGAKRSVLTQLEGDRIGKEDLSRLENRHDGRFPSWWLQMVTDSKYI